MLRLLSLNFLTPFYIVDINILFVYIQFASILVVFFIQFYAEINYIVYITRGSRYFGYRQLQKSLIFSFLRNIMERKDTFWEGQNNNSSSSSQELL